MPRPAVKHPAAPPDERRCMRTNGKLWRCRKPRAEGRYFCEDHHLQQQMSSKKAASLGRSRRTRQWLRRPSATADQSVGDQDDEGKDCRAKVIVHKRRGKASVAAEKRKRNSMAVDEPRGEEEEHLTSAPPMIEPPSSGSISDSEIDSVYQMANDLVKTVDSFLTADLISSTLKGPLKKDYTRFLHLLEAPFDEVVQRHSSEIVDLLVRLSTASVETAGLFNEQQQRQLIEMKRQIRSKIEQALAYQVEIKEKMDILDSAKNLASSILMNKEKDDTIRCEDIALAKMEEELKNKLREVEEERARIKHERKALVEKTKELLSKNEGSNQRLASASTSTELANAQLNLKILTNEWNVFKLSFKRV